MIRSRAQPLLFRKEQEGFLFFNNPLDRARTFVIYYAPKLEQGPDGSGRKGKMKEGLYIACDTETYYEKSKYSVAGKNGLTMRQYADDKRFDCYLVSLAIKSDDAEKFGIDVAGWEDFEYKSPSTGETVSLKAVAKHPSEINWMQFDGATLVQHNANFDCEVLRRLVKDGKVPEFEHKVVDTADMIAYLGIRRSLQAGMKFVFGIEVSKKVRSDMDGKRVEQLSPSEREALYRYGTDDAVHCFMLWLECGHKWPYVERRMSELNRESNMRGILTDVDLVESGLERLRRIYSDGASKLPWMMAENPEDRYPASSCPALAKWLEAHGYEIPKSFNKNGNDFMDWKKVLDKEKDAELLSILDARIAVTGTQPHIARLETMLAQVDEDNRLHPGFVYFGAHTGRFTAGVAGERDENNKKSADDPKNLNLLNMAKKPVYGVDLRAMYIAGPGRKLVIADYSQVEARALLWIVDDEQMCAALMDGKSNLYQLTAVKMVLCPPDVKDLKHDAPFQYQLAKQCLTAESLVLVRSPKRFGRGLTSPYYKRIIRITGKDWVWDGHEWVRQLGAKKMKEVEYGELIEFGGVCLTKDHKVYVGDETGREAGSVLGDEQAAAVAWGQSTSPVQGWSHVRVLAVALVGACARALCLALREACHGTLRQVPVHRVRQGDDASVGQRAERPLDAVQQMRAPCVAGNRGQENVGEGAR